MQTFFVDEKLTDSESEEALRVLASRGVKTLEYKRIPFVFPVHGEQVTNEKMVEILKGHLRNAGVPIGVQSIFIVPKEGIRWAILLQEAFYLVTGYYPVMIQQWQRSVEDGGETLTRRDYLNMIDMHAAMSQ